MRDRNQLTTSAANSAPARLPSIDVPANIDPALRRVIEAIKERLEVREGARGNPYEKVVTRRDLEQALAASNSQSVSAASDANGVSRAAISTDEIAAEAGKLRAEAVRIERHLLALAQTLYARYQADGGINAQQAVLIAQQYAYDAAQLETDLANGAASIISGATGGSAVMEMAPDGAWVLFKHKDANINGLGAGYSGVYRTAIGITAAGLIAGYNRQDTGAWQNSVVIDSSTGNVTILGTLKANSVIETNAYIGSLGGTTIGQVQANAAQALSDAAAAETEALNASSLAATKLNKSIADSISGEISFTDDGSVKAGTISVTSTGVVSGTGIALTQAGLFGVKSSAVTFSITNAGDATFAGDVVTGGDAQFSGKATSTRTVTISGTNYSVDYSAWADATTSATSATYVRCGFIGYAAATTSQYNVGIIGRAPSTTKGFGVVGDGGNIGGYFSTTNSLGTALVAVNSSGGKGLDVTGTAVFNNSISITGSVTASGNVTAYSDVNLKTDINRIESALDKVKALTGYTFTRKDTGARQTGLIAQDVQAVLPEAVEEHDGVLSLAYGNLVGLLVEAVKELEAKVNAK